MQNLSALSSQNTETGPPGTGDTSGDSQREGLDLLAISTTFVDGNARIQRRIALIGLPVSVYGYVGKERTNLSLIAEGTTDGRGRIGFFLPAGAYIVNFRYQLFGSNVTLDLPVTRSIVEMNWTVSKRTLRPLTLVFGDKFAVGELGPGDTVDAYFRGREERLPVVVEVGPDLRVTNQPNPSLLLDVNGGAQSEGSQWVQLSPANKLLLTQIDPQAGADYTAYWVTVGERTRPWR